MKCFICNKSTVNNLFCITCIENNKDRKYKKNKEICTLCNSKFCKTDGKYELCIHIELFKKYFKLIKQIDTNIKKNL